MEAPRSEKEVSPVLQQMALWGFWCGGAGVGVLCGGADRPGTAGG